MALDERATSTRRHRFPLARVAAAITLLSWVIQGVQRSGPTTVPQAPPPEAAPVWSTDVNLGAAPPPPGGRVVTGKLLEGQKPARGGTCGFEDQVAIGAGCWLTLEKKPKPPPIRCGDYFEHAGKCYVPVKANPRLPTSIPQPPPVRCGDRFEFDGDCLVPINGGPKLPASSIQEQP